MSKDTRYIAIQIPITEADARKRKASAISYARAQIAHREEQLEEAKEELKFVRERHLETTRESYLTLEPGDDGYDEAPIGFNGLAYVGEFKWINHPKET